jgi:two-component system sensor histidine kinase YesM
MLQQQINPHFLYNTLDSINWMAQNCGANEISIMARSLGNIFRGAINTSEDFISLDKELEFLNNYIQIQSFRFKQRLNYEMIISNGYKTLQIPKMILQPLVENAIKHGLEDSFEPCIIRVSIEETESIFQIKVSNTCSEFEPDLLQKLENKELIPGGTGVGLLNIDKRLKLIYGENYGLTFYNQDAMAIAVVSIPKANSN